jgi:crossover junction endodeoxyribonuclease RuvC
VSLTFTHIIGVDPGYSGAIAVLTARPPPSILLTMPMPIIKGGGSVKDELDEQSIFDLFQIVASFGPAHVFIERVSAMPGQGVTSMFRFGVSYGVVRALAAAAGLPLTLILPQVWKRKVGLPMGGGMDSKTAKALSRQRADALFPGNAFRFARVKDAGVSDAVLIALAGLSILERG